MIGTSELLLIAALVLLLFGGKKLPEMMKGLGQGVRSFKDGMKDVSDENVQGKKIGRAVQQECRDRSRMPSSA